MLKIKDSVDLKELEKFGFQARYDELREQVDFYLDILLSNINESRG